VQQELKIELLLEEVVKRKASDLHLQTGLQPMLRVDGALLPIAGTPNLDEEGVERLVFTIFRPI
jgi:twitching motility protein PilT